jgi:CRP-like cAMP-binding protein
LGPVTAPTGCGCFPADYLAQSRDGSNTNDPVVADRDGGPRRRVAWLIQSGYVALDLHVPGQGRMKIDTIGIGELVRWSWLFPPYEWAFGAVAASPVEGLRIRRESVRASYASDPTLGYKVTQRLARVLAKRLQSTTVRLIRASVQVPGVR